MATDNRESLNSNQYSHIIVGGDYFAFIYAYFLRAFHPEDSILLIEQDRSHHLGTLFAGTMTELDRQVWQKLGQKLGLTPLKELGNYLTQHSTIYQVDDKFIHRGENVRANLREILRKFNLDIKNFSEADQATNIKRLFELFAEDFCREIIQEKLLAANVPQDNREKEKIKARSFFKKMLQEFDLPKNTWEEKKMQALSFLLKADNFKLIDRHNIPRSHLFNLFVFAGAHYQLDTERFKRDLKASLKEKNIQFKNTEIEGWQLKSSKKDKGPSEILLSGHEGLIKAKRIHYIGNPNLPTPFYAENDYNNFFVSYKLKVTVTRDIHLLPTRLFSTSTNSFASDFPLNILAQNRDGSFNFYGLVKKKWGQKASFYADNVENNLIRTLTHFIERDAFYYQLDTLKDGHDKWPEGMFEEGPFAQGILSLTPRFLRIRKRPAPRGISTENQEIVNNLNVWSTYYPLAHGGAASLIASWPAHL